MRAEEHPSREVGVTDHGGCDLGGAIDRAPEGRRGGRPGGQGGRQRVERRHGIPLGSGLGHSHAAGTRWAFTVVVGGPSRFLVVAGGVELRLVSYGAFGAHNGDGGDDGESQDES